LRLRAPCYPGIQGCVLHGKVRFIDRANPPAQTKPTKAKPKLAKPAKAKPAKAKPAKAKPKLAKAKKPGR
jgi:hypothetical protein